MLQNIPHFKFRSWRSFFFHPFFSSYHRQLSAFPGRSWSGVLNVVGVTRHHSSFSWGCTDGSGLDTGYHQKLSGFPGIYWSGVSSMVGVTRHRSIKWSASFSHDSTKLREKWNIPWLSNHSRNHITILLCKIKLTFKQSKTLSRKPVHSVQGWWEHAML